MQPAPILANESERLAALRRYDILDTPAEADFDSFTRLASQICGTPVATITLVDAARQWFKSKIGLEVNETPRDISFCGHAITGREILEVPDALEDERFRDNPLVVGETNVRFYAGAPLVTPDGLNIGALCVFDRTAHHLTPEQREMLTLLSLQVVHLLELRLAGRRIKWLNENLEHTVTQRTEELRAANTELEAKNSELSRQAEDRLRRMRAETAKAKAEAARERAAFLVAASNVLASSLDHREMFEALARLLIPSFADCCMVDLVQEDGALQPIVVAHRDEEIRRRVIAFRAAFPARLDDGRGFAATPKGTAPLLCKHFGQKQIAEFARGPAEEEAMRNLEIRSCMVVALRARGRTLGGLCLARITERRYDDADLSLAVELAEYAGLALDNSRLYAEARQAREASEAANAAKDRFLAMLSHELRTPLSPVLHAATLLESMPCPEPMRATLETIRRNVQLEARLIDDLLDLARIRSGKLQIHVEPVDAHDLLRRAVQICESEIQTRHLRVTLDLRAQHPWLEADPARIQQIFWNLITNAVKYTPPEGAITLRSEDDEREGSIRFEISDSGIGLDLDRLERIFDAFEQGRHGRSGGLGLGLAICRALVTLHGGRIEARTRGSGLGSTFTVTLPVDRAFEARHMNVAAAPLQPVANGLRLLLVEDHGDSAAILERLLANCGYVVKTANSFASAWRQLEESEFDLLVSDIGLPDGSGLHLMPKFIEAAAGRPIAGIVLSGFGMPEDVERAYSAGFHEHLTKPVDFTLLRKTLARLSYSAENLRPEHGPSLRA